MAQGSNTGFAKCSTDIPPVFKGGYGTGKGGVSVWGGVGCEPDGCRKKGEGGKSLI